MRLLKPVLLVVILSLSFGGCRARETRTPARQPSPKRSVTIYVPCGLSIPFMDAIDAFKKANPGVEVIPKMESDVELLKEVENGEKPDLFVSPGGREAQVLEAKGLVKEKASVGSYVIVVTVPRDNPAHLEKVADLASPGVRRIAIPNPERNSVGFFAKQSLTKLGLWDAVEKKAQITERAMDAHTMVMRGQADAGFSFKSCPLDTNPERAKASRIKMGAELPTDSYDTPRIVVAVLSTSKNAAVAEKLMRFLSSGEGVKLLLASGLPDEQGQGSSLAQKGTSTEQGSQIVETSGAKVIIKAFYPRTSTPNDPHQASVDLARSFEKKHPGRVKVYTYESNNPAGNPQDFAEWKKSGLTCAGILINGRDIYDVTRGGKTYPVTFHKAVGAEWKAEELEAAVKQEVEKVYGGR